MAEQKRSAIWWLSFADQTRPTGQHFLGVALVIAGDMAQAVRVAWKLGVNPGGEVLGMELPTWCWGLVYENLLPVGKLLTRAEAEALDQIFVQRRPTEIQTRGGTA